MRILELPSWYLPEGGQFCLHQSIALQEAGIDVHILANVVLPWKKYNFKLLQYPLKAFFTEENGLTSYRYFSWRYPFLDSLNTKKWIRKTLRLYENYIKKEGHPDLIHAHSSMWGGYVAALIKEKYKIPYVITEHRGRFSENSESTKGLFQKYYQPYLSKAFLEANKIITVSDQLQKKIKEYGNLNIETISNIVDTDFFKNTNSEKYENFSFINANSFDYAKGYDILLPAFDKHCEDYPNSSLLILGENFNSSKFQEIHNKLNHKENVQLLGLQDKAGVLNFLNKSHIFVLSSRIEAQPVAILEAMSCGLPCVCTEVVPKEVANQKAAIQCKKNSIKDLADAMKLGREKYSSFKAEEIRDFAKSICSKKVVAQKIINTYKSILNK